MTGTTACIPRPEAEPIPVGAQLASWCDDAVRLGISFADAFPCDEADACLAGDGLDEAGTAVSVSFDLFEGDESRTGQASRHAPVERAKDGRRRPGLQAGGLPAARCSTALRFSRRRNAAALRRA